MYRYFLARRPGSGILFALAILIASSCVFVSARAASVCVPSAVGVPGEPGLPEWWGIVTGRKDDPRWCGSMGVGHALDRGRFRALHAEEGGTDYLYLNWEIRGDAGGIGQEFIHFGFVDPLSTTKKMIVLK